MLQVTFHNHPGADVDLHVLTLDLDVVTFHTIHIYY